MKLNGRVAQTNLANVVDQQARVAQACRWTSCGGMGGSNLVVNIVEEQALGVWVVRGAQGGNNFVGR